MKTSVIEIILYMGKEALFGDSKTMIQSEESALQFRLPAHMDSLR